MSGVLNLLLAGAASAIKDAYFNLTTLLLNTSSTNGAQNNTFLDSSTNNFTITRNGNTTQGTFTPFSQTGWSNFFDGATNSYLALPSNTAFAFGTGAYTVEGWLYQTARSTNEALFFGANGGSGFLAYITNTGAVNSGSITGSAGDIPLNTWCHVAFVRNSTGTNDTKIYVNGVVKATGTDATDWTSSGDPRIGMLTANTNYAIKGYISNFRIVKGTAVYTAAFTPPTTPLTAISGTSVLTCQSNRFLDISSNAFTVTATGTMSVQAFSPFLPTAAYDAAVVGGSGYFDGSGDYLSCGSQSAYAFGTGNFTLEAWVYVSDRNAQYNIAATRGSGATVNGWNINITTSGGIVVFTDNFVFNNVGTVPLNAWTHIVFTRSGTGTNQTVIYINGVSVATATNSQDFSNTTLGVGNANDGSQYPFLGYISGVRLVKGTAVYTAAFTPPTAPLTAITNTSLLLSCTNAGIFDSAAKNVLETVGNAQVSTTQAKWGTTSMYFDGSGDYLQVQSSVAPSNFNMGTGDYTVEFWMYSGTPGSQQCLFDFRNADVSGQGIAINYRTDRTIAVYMQADRITSSAISANTWTHIAVVRASGTYSLYINGVSAGTWANSDVVAPPANRPIIGAVNNGTQEYNGYLDDLRITKGYARYTTTFTPPAAAFAIQ